MGLWYPKDFGFELIAYLDSDHAGCKDDCKSTSGGLQFLGEKLVSWSSKKQDYTVMSTVEVEYVSLSACCAQEHVEKGTVELYFVGTEYQLADLFSKALPKERFEYLVHRIVIIMAQQQHAADVHPDELCPPNKRYDLMDANKKVDFEQVQCPPESKILMNIIKDHPLRFSIAASSSVPWIYMAQFWHTLKEDGSKYRLTFMLDKKMLSLTLDDFRTIFHLPQATDNNHDSFVPPPSFLDMVPFYKNELGFTMELKTSSSFKTTGLLQPWQTLCKIFSKCLTTRVTGWDQPPLQIMQMMYCFINNIHVDYAELLWEGLYYSLHHPTSSIPYPRFTKIIISHYMTNFPEISRRARDIYHNLKDDDIMKNIFNSGRHKDRVGMKIPDWMISDKMKHTKHYQMYAEVFGIDVPLTQSQPTESTQGTHRTPSAPRSPNPKVDAGESSALKRSTMIHFRIPQRRSIRLTPPAPVPTIDKADEMILQDTLQVSLVEHKIREEQKARETAELVNKHLAFVEIEKRVEESENVIDDSLIPRNVDQNIPGTRLEPRKKEQITDKVYELKRREKGKIVEESKSTPSPTPIRFPRIHTDLVSSDIEKLHELTVTNTTLTPSSSSLYTKLSTRNRLLSRFKAKPAHFKCYKSFFQELQGRYGYLFEHLRAKFLSRKSFDTLADHLQEVMVESLPTMVDKHIKEQVEKQVPKHLKFKFQSQPQTTFVPEQQYQLYLSMKNNPQLQKQDIAIWLAHQMKFETLQVSQTNCRTYVVRPRDQDDPHDDDALEGENSAKRQKTSEYEAHVTGESSEHVNEREQSPSSSDNDEILTKQVSQDFMEEVSLTINEAELKKIADEMLRQRCTSGDEHQYHIDQMKNFLKSDIVWESRKEIIASPHPRKTTPLVQSCQRDPEAPALSLINQDLLYLKKGNSGPEKIVLSLHKFPIIIFNDVDIEERTSIWVNKCVKRFNPYARYVVEHWKNPHAKIFYIKRQKEPGKPKEVFITEIVTRRANECIVSITESDYKNLNKNDIEDIYLLIINGKVPDYAETESYQQKVNLTAPTISFPGIEKHKMFYIIYEPVHGIIYKNSKKEKRVMRHSEIHKLYDAVLEGLKSYNNDVKYGYKQRDLTEDEVEYLKLFDNEIEVRLKYRNQMRRWEKYVNGRPVGPRTERPE
ncbi:hypothetical protein Tco_1218498 [Tanacetum coccineum]